MQAGESYIFKVRAKNIYGYGDFSAEVTFVPVNEPATMEAVTTTLNYPNIDLTWVQPDESGSTITEYELVIYDNGLTAYREDTTLCDGSESVTFDARSCSIDIDTLIADFGY